MTDEQAAELDRIADELQPALMIRDLSKRLREAEVRNRNWDALYTVALSRIHALEAAAVAYMNSHFDTTERWRAARERLAEVLEEKCTNS